MLTIIKRPGILSNDSVLAELRTCWPLTLMLGRGAGLELAVTTTLPVSNLAPLLVSLAMAIPFGLLTRF